MATVLMAYGWECGHRMLPSDRYSAYSLNPSTSANHTGNYGVEMNNGSFWYVFDSTPANPSVSVWLKHNTEYGVSGTVRLRFRLTSGEYIDLRWNGSSHTWDAYVDDTLVASGSVEVSQNDWFHTQFYAVISDSGSIQVKVGGHLSIDYSGDTLPAGGNAAVDRAVIYCSGSGNILRADDWVIGTGGLLGDLRCYDLRPNADTAQADWTPSTGSDHYALLDETPEDDSDYISADANGDADELGLGDFNESDMAPVAVVAWARAKADDATGAQLKVGVDSNGTDDTTTVSLSTSWEYYSHVLDDDPDTSSEWTDSGVDALKLLVEAVIS